MSALRCPATYEDPHDFTHARDSADRVLLYCRKCGEVREIEVRAFTASATNTATATQWSKSASRSTSS